MSGTTGRGNAQADTRPTTGRTWFISGRCRLAHGKRLALVLILSAAFVLTPSKATSAHAAFPGLNGKIAFDRAQVALYTREPVSIYDISANGSDQRKLLDNADSPAWSPDGKKIAFFRSITASKAEIDVANTNGSDLKTLTVVNYPMSMAWSPDGREIIFAEDFASGPDIFLMNANGSHQRKLLSNADWPAWSPDGSKIAFHSLANHGNEIDIANSNGSNPTRLVAACSPQCSSPSPREPPPDGVDKPSWSPDGQKIAFESYVVVLRGRNGYPVPEINVANANGSDQKSLTHLVSLQGNLQPVWSPDGTKIAFERVHCYPEAICPRAQQVSVDLYVMNANGSNQLKVADNASAPDWQPLPGRQRPGPPQNVTVFGNDVVGQPNVSHTWALGGFDTAHMVTGGESTSCFTALGCRIDNLSASINWGDGSPTSAGTVLCTLPVFPFPPPKSVQMHCTANGTHTYSARNAHAVDITVSNSTTILAEAQITQTPKRDQIDQSVGELVAYDTLGPNSKFTPCTATATLSVNQDVIVTAAHCVADILSGDGHIFAHFKFAPGHSGPTCAMLEKCGVNPHGVFQAVASDATIFPGVMHKQRLDWAFVRVAPLGGSKLDQVVSAVATQFNPSPIGSTWLTMGYPYSIDIQVGPPDLGEVLLYFRTCSGTSTTGGDAGPPGPSQVIIAACSNPPSGLTEGSSGGPWLSPDGAVGAVNKAVNATGLLGTYLGDEAQKAFLMASLE